MSGLDIVELPSGRARDGLVDMLRPLELDGYIHGFVEVHVALLIVELAKRAEDRPEWFPHGKWATIQAIQAQCDKQLDDLFPNG